MAATRTSANANRNLQNMIFWSAQYQVKGLENKISDIIELVFRDGRWIRRSEIGVRGLTRGSAQAKRNAMRRELMNAIQHEGIFRPKGFTDKREVATLKDVDQLTVDHISGSYCHVTRKETKKHKGTRFMFKDEHKSMTCTATNKRRWA